MAESIASLRRVSTTGSIIWNSKKQGVDQVDFATDIYRLMKKIMIRQKHMKRIEQIRGRLQHFCRKKVQTGMETAAQKYRICDIAIKRHNERTTNGVYLELMLYPWDYAATRLELNGRRWNDHAGLAVFDTGSKKTVLEASQLLSE